MTIIALSNKNAGGRFPWRLFFRLLAMGVFGLVASLPYGLSLAGENLAGVSAIAVQFISQLITLSILAGLGVLLARSIGLGAPILSGRLRGEGMERWGKVFLQAVLLGAVAGFLVMALDIWVFAPRLQEELGMLGALAGGSNPPAWQGLLASFYGAINEEIMLRLFLLTLIVWLGVRIRRGSQPSRFLLWSATIIAGLAFGVGHLPAAAALGIPMTPLYITRIIVLNMSGILFGWLYWKRGLESAMVAHFTVDIILHVVGAFLVNI